jgi:hypothetical protein
MDPVGRKDGAYARRRESLHIIATEVDLVAEFVRQQLPPLAAMDMASHLGLIKRTLDEMRRRA